MHSSWINMIHSEAHCQWFDVLAGAAISEWAWAFVMRSTDCSSPISTYWKHEANPGAVIPTAHVQQSSSRQGGIEMNNKGHCVVGGIGAYDIYGNYCVYYILDIVCGWSQLCSPAARQWSGRRAAAALLLVTCVPGPRSYWPPVLPRCVHVRGAGCQHAQLHTARAAHGPRVLPRAGSLWGAWWLVAVFITGSAEPGSSHRSVYIGGKKQKCSNE